MVNWTMTVLTESLLGSLVILRTLAIIIIPLMVALQIMTDYKWMEKLSEKTKWVTGFLGVSKDTLVALLIGIFAGVSYGAGAIIFAKEKYNLAKDDVFLAMCFLIPFHGMIEATLVLWMLGVNPILLITCRLFVALAGTLIFKLYVQKKRRKETATLNG